MEQITVSEGMQMLKDASKIVLGVRRLVDNLNGSHSREDIVYALMKIIDSSRSGTIGDKSLLLFESWEKQDQEERPYSCGCGFVHTSSERCGPF
ncbi:MAG: hypothetical protein WC511_02125 [Candidatus Pacearchaeota archaeon]